MNLLDLVKLEKRHPRQTGGEKNLLVFPARTPIKIPASRLGKIGWQQRLAPPKLDRRKTRRSVPRCLTPDSLVRFQFHLEQWTKSRLKRFWPKRSAGPFVALVHRWIWWCKVTPRRACRDGLFVPAHDRFNFYCSFDSSTTVYPPCFTRIVPFGIG
jgi:hypothetical protein